MGNDVTDRIHYGVDGYLRARDPLIDKCYGYTVYGHLTPSHKWYFGITKQRPEQRWGKRGQRYSGCTAFERAINKYGWNNIYHIIIGTGLTKDEACEIEQRLIAEYNTTNPKYGYNLLSGGQIGSVPSDITKERLKMRRPARPVWCIETGQFFMSAKDAAKTFGVAEETIARCCRGSVATSCGCHWSYLDESPKVKARSPLRKNMNRGVVCCDNGIIYKNASAVAKEYGCSCSNIVQAIKKGRKYKGLSFRYV